MGARAVLLRALVALCAFVSFMAFATDAFAGYGHAFVSSFGSFVEVTSLAVDSSSGDVYVFDSGSSGFAVNTGSILKFNAAGEPVNFAATGSNAITGLTWSGHAELAVDNSSGPAKGDIYLTTGNGANLRIYSPAGEQIGELSGEPCSVATDPSGNVYVGYSQSVKKYVPSGNPVKDADLVSSMGGLQSACEIAADSTGSVFVNAPGSWEPVIRYEATQFGSLSATGATIDPYGTSVAVDPSTDEVYVGEHIPGREEGVNQVSEFVAHGEPEEAPLATFAHVGPGAIRYSQGLAVSGFNHEVYVSDGNGHVNIFGPLVNQPAPAATTGAASNVLAETVTAHGTVTPNGNEVAQCEVEYGPTAFYGQVAPCAESPAEIGPGSAPVAVHADLAGLQPASEYHYRVVAHNGGGAGYGADQTFRTQGPPTVGTGLSSNVAPESATVSGSVSPNGVELNECKFEYGPTSSYGQSAPCVESSAEIGSGSALVEVHADLSGLQGGSTYHYRLVAANSWGAAQGGDRTLATPALPIVSSQFAFNVARTETDVGAQVDPNGAPTTYHVDYGLSSSYGQSTPESQPIGAINDNSYHEVTVHVMGLQPGSTYHARLVATNSVGSTAGPDLTFTTFLPQQVTTGGCPNEGRREEQNATYLPDCRAYEKVSPVEKNGSDVIGNGRYMQVSASGDRVNYGAVAGFGDTAGSNALGMTQYIGERGVQGWTSHGVTPTSATNIVELFGGVGSIKLFSESMEKAIVGEYDLPVVTDDIPKVYDLYVENSDTRALEAITKPVSGESYTFTDFENNLRGASPDLGLVAVESEKSLLPGMPAGSKYYIWNHGTLELSGVLPDGSLPAGGSGAPLKTISFYRDHKAFSHDDSRVLFRAPVSGPQETQLYMRRDSAETVWVSEPESSSPPAEPHGVTFQDMTPDGSKVVFTSSDRLTDSDPGGPGVGLYLYTDGPHPEAESNLRFIVRADVEGSGQSVEEGDEVAGMSGDAKRIYFFTKATAQLPRGGTYLWDEGTLHLVAKTDLVSKGPSASGNIAQVSADGRRMAFVVSQQLTEAPVGGGSHRTMYVYDESKNTLKCASCLPSGTPTTSDVFLEPHAVSQSGVGLKTEYAPRFLSEDGRYVFFTTFDALSSQDVNNRADVYEYDVETGTVSLLTSGTGENSSWFIGSSNNGSDAFFVSRQSFLAEDPDTLVDLYDVRVDGGFSQPKPQTGGCVGDECQGLPSAAPSFNTASGFEGLGNIRQPSVPGKASVKKLTRAQKLARALKVCKRKHDRARHRCVAQARKRYGPKKRAKKSTSSHGARL
jgi:hypothetical protein